VRQLRTDQAAANAERGEVRLVSKALGELGGATDDRPGVEVYDLLLLTSARNPTRSQHAGREDRRSIGVGKVTDRKVVALRSGYVIVGSLPAPGGSSYLVDDAGSGPAANSLGFLH